MRVLVSGGGIAGLTLAYWLRRGGHTPVVIEKAKHSRIGGYGFDFHGTGYDLATRMGIVDRLRKRPLRARAVEWVDRQGRVTARLHRDLLERATGGAYLGLMHTTLEEVLTDEVAGDVEIRYDQTLRSVAQDGTAVDATFADGTEETFDLLVGADGIHSRTRELVFGPERDFTRYLGYYLACYPLPAGFDPGPVRQHHTEPGRQTVVYATDEADQAIALFLFRSPDRGSIPRAERLSRLEEAFAGAGWITPQLLAAAPDPAEIFMDTVTQVVMPSWHRQRVGLIGDASGCMTLVSGQGVSMAMAAGYLLAEQLRSADHLEALAAYERRLRPEVERRQARARSMSRLLVPKSRLGVRVGDLVQRLVLRKAFLPLLRLQVGGGSILPPAGEAHPSS